METIKKANRFENVDQLKIAFKETIANILSKHNVHIDDDKIDFYVNDVLAISNEQRKKSKSSDMEIYITKFANILSNSETNIVTSIIKGLEYKFGVGNVVKK